MSTRMILGWRRTWHRIGMALICSMGIMAVRAAAQDRQPETVTQPRGSAASVIVASRDDYRIGISDVITVSIDKALELSGNYRVSSKGTISMPYLGAVVANGKSPEELGRYIADRLRDRYLREPIVTVDVSQCNSRAFFIQGSVRSPGVYYIEGRVTLFQLITVAGGLDKDHGSTAFVIRQKANPSDELGVVPGAAVDPKPDRASQSPVQAPGIEGEEASDDYEAIAVNIKALTTGQFEKNMVIQPGDWVQIPATDIFLVGGEVKAPGQFPLRPGTTLRQAIALAQGMTFNAAKGKGAIFRENPVTGQAEEIHVDLGALMNGKGKDLLIRANDVIIVPNSKLRTISGGLFKAFGLSFASLRRY
jgi:polysaccharide biosynthesis/export protein